MIQIGSIVLNFMIGYGFLYGINIICSKVLPEKCVGHIKTNKVLDIVLLLKPLKYKGQTVLIFSVLQQLLLLYCTIKYIVIIINSFLEPRALLNATFGEVYFVGLCIPFLGFILCRCIYEWKNKKKKGK